MAQEQKLTTGTGRYTIAELEAFDRQINTWAVRLVKERPELAKGLLAVHEKRQNGSKPSQKVMVLIYGEQEEAMKFLAANQLGIERPSAHVIAKMGVGYLLERLAVEVKEVFEQ